VSTSYSYNFPGEINMSIGILDCQGVDYRTSNPTLLLKHFSYMGENYFNGMNIHCASNTYDDGIVGFIPQIATDMAVHQPLLCYNDSSGNLVIQCNTNATTGVTFKKSSIFSIPSKVGKTSLSVSANIALSSNFTSNYVSAYVHYVNTTGVSQSLPMISSFNSTTNVYTLTYTTALSNLASKLSWIGISFNVRNVAGGPTNKYTIQNVNVTTT
jgi:hypothetical protein